MKTSEPKLAKGLDSHSWHVNFAKTFPALKNFTKS